MVIRNDKDLQALLRIGQICGQTVQHMMAHVEPGITTKELDRIGANFLKKQGAASAPITAYNYPGWTCISVNEEAAHGIPGKRVIKAGDVVNIDVSAVLEGYWADTGATMLVPPAKPKHEKLCEDTKQALYAGINAARAGKPLSDIGRAIETQAKKGRYKMLKALNGHGVGRSIHEDPTVPNFYMRKTRRYTLHEGLVITIEPFFNLGRGHIVTDDDGWTLRTPDRSISAQYEHTVVITDGEPILVTKVEGSH